MTKLSRERIYEQVRRIPEGRVATYGQIAELAGFPRYARQVGYALAALRQQNEYGIPWQRVINARGTISRRAQPGYEEYQRILLEDEGVVFDDDGRVSLTRFQWQPGDSYK